MIARLFLFEVRYWLRQPMVYIFLLINTLMVFGAVSTENIQIGGSVGNVYRNAPEVVYNFYGIMSFIGLLMVTAFVNGTAIRDFHNNTSQIVFSTPITKAQYLTGKFLGSTFIALLPMLGLSFGVILGSWMPWQDPVRIGPNMLAPHLEAFLLFALPNGLFTSAVIFAVAVLTRSTIASFVSAIVLMVGYLISQSLMTSVENEISGAMIDPFGLNALDQVTKYWTVVDKNTMLLPVSGPLLWNRMLWVAVSIGVFLFGYFRFSFHDRKQKAAALPSESTNAQFTSRALPKVSRAFGVGARWRQFRHQVRMELKSIVTGPVFIIVMLLGVAQLISSLAYVTSLYDNTTYPVTYNVIDLIQDSFYLYVVIVVTFYSGALVWRERDPNMNDITDALPVPTWLGLVGKFATMLVLLTIVLLLSMCAGMVTQLLNGYTHLEPLLYLAYFIVPGLVSFGFLTMLALCIHTLVNNKYLGYFVFIVVLAVNTFLWNGIDIESRLVTMNGASLEYSDMSHFGPYFKPWLFFRSYWWTFGLILLFIAFMFRVRGRENGAKWRLRTAALRLRQNRKFALPLLAVWLLLGAWGYYNTKVLNSYTTDDVEELNAVRYEKDYKRFADIAQPHYTDLSFVIDIDSYARSLNFSVEATTRNLSNVPIDSVHLNLPGDRDWEIDMEGAELVKNDEELNYRIYRLRQPLTPGAALTFTLKGHYRARGFENSVSFVQVVGNGTFFNNMDLIPVIGYADDGELSDRNDRRKHGLPVKERMQALSDDPAKRMNTYLVHNSDWVNVRTTISTAADQIAVAPGSLKKEWTADGKRYFQYELDHASMNFYSFLSARYEVAREKWTPPSGGQAVDVEVYYDKAHAVNVPRMINSMKKALAYYTENFGPYRQKQVRILEFDRFLGTFAQAFPGTMPYSESIGFITDLTAQEDIDMVFYVVAHEMGHQWWAHQVIGADMQGATWLSESMAQYSALMVMEKEYGRDHMRKFLKLEGDKYQRSRGGETQREVPLMYVENQGYIHYNKASVVMYCMREFVGEDTLNKAFRALVDSFAYKPPPYPTALNMYSALRKATPDSLTYLLEDNFKHITLYNNRLLSATSRMLPDSSYEVIVTFTAEKNHADTLGRETPIAMNDWIDVGFLAEPTGDEDEGELRFAKRERVRSGENTFTYHLSERPYQAAIDPQHLFFDRVSDDNVKKVE